MLFSYMETVIVGPTLHSPQVACHTHSTAQCFLSAIWVQSSPGAPVWHPGSRGLLVHSPVFDWLSGWHNIQLTQLYGRFGMSFTHVQMFPTVLPSSLTSTAFQPETSMNGLSFTSSRVLLPIRLLVGWSIIRILQGKAISQQSNTIKVLWMMHPSLSNLPWSLLTSSWNFIARLHGTFSHSSGIQGTMNWWLTTRILHQTSSWDDPSVII